jgi:predicted dehydrogenase
MKKLSVAVCGLGWWGRIMVPLLKTSSTIDVVKVFDPASSADDLGVARAASFEELLKDKTVQGVVLCTPHTLHAGQIVAAANAKKHVFCEKPLSLSRKDVLRAVEACNANGVQLAVGHEKRFEPPIIEIMRLVKSGALGTPLQVEANFSQDKFLALDKDNWRLSGAEAPAGPMTATGIHLLDLSVGVFGEAETVFTSVKQLGSALTNGDTLAALVTFKRGGHALISAMLATPFAGRFAVFGSHGWAEVRDKTHPEAPEGWTLTTCLRGGRAQSVEMAPAPAVLHNLEAFADAATGRAAYPVPREQMIANVSALEAIFRSAASGAVEIVEGRAR